jgi:3-hydroxyisobutyrate dehydrogenase
MERSPAATEGALSSPRLRVAVLGMGTLGAPMARNIAAGPVDVRVWNRSSRPWERLVAAGVEVCSSVPEAVSGADIVLTVLSDDAALTAVMDHGGGLDAIQAGAIWIQSSTIGVEDTKRWTERAEKAGALFVDAPVLGTRGPAERGELTILGSGPEDARERCRPLFDAIGKSTLWLGPAGAGTRLKLVVNSWLLSLVQVLAESLAFCQAMGFEPETLFDTLERGGVSLPYVRLKGGAMAREEFPPDFTLRLARKDLQLVLDAATDVRLPLSIVEAALAGFDRAIERGHGDDDYAATYLATRSAR